MAELYIGLNRGQYTNQVVYGSSTNNTDVELRVNLATGIQKEEVLEALEGVKLLFDSGAAIWGDNNT